MALAEAAAAAKNGSGGNGNFGWLWTFKSPFFEELQDVRGLGFLRGRYLYSGCSFMCRALKKETFILIW